MQRIREVLLAAALICISASGVAQVVSQVVPLGDGLGMLRSFDPVRGTVVVNGQMVQLAADASVALQRQLVRYGLAGEKTFGARYNVSHDGSGRPVIDVIEVFPPKRR
jgi:predicted trehalose synthase